MMVDSRGQELSKDDAIMRMGGKDAAYIEIVSAPSRLEVECLLARARYPDLEREEVMAAHFARQALILDPSGKAVVAVHGSSDGGFHAHILLPGDKGGYKRLEGPYGQSQYAFDKAWEQDRPKPQIRDWNAHGRAKEIEAALTKLDFQAARKALVQGQKDALKVAATPEERNAIREGFAQRERVLESENHSLQVAKLEAFYRARGTAGSLEHQVKLAREEMRHTAEDRRAEARRLGQNAYQARYSSADQKEAFRHLNAAERAPIRAEALARELDVLKARYAAEKGVIDQDPTRFPEDKEESKADQDRHCEEAIKAALLRHQASLLRDREEDIQKAPGQTFGEKWVRSRLRGNLSKIPGATIAMRADALQTRTDLMAARHSLERQALVAEARSRGLQEPPAKALVKLDARQEKERNSLGESKAKLALLTPSRQVGKTLKRSGSRAIVGGISKAREGLKKLQKAASKKGKEVEKPRTMEHLDSGQQVAEGAVLGAVAGVGKVGLTAAMEGGKAALSQAQNAGQAIAVTAQAIATGLVDPLAGAKEAASGYSKVGAAVAKDAMQDVQSGSKNVSKDAVQEAKSTAQQTLGGLASMGISAMPEELQACIRATKAATMAAISTAKSVITLDVLGAASSAGGGVLEVAKEGGAAIRGSLPLPMEKVMDLAAKIPLVGIVAQGAKLGLELGAGAAKAAKSIDIDR